MSLALTRVIWDREDLKGSTKLVALALARLCVQKRAEPDRYQCWPEIADVARACGFQRRRTCQLLAELLKREDIVRSMRRGPRSSLYCFVPLAYGGQCPRPVCARCHLAPDDAPCRPKDMHSSAHLSRAEGEKKCTILHKEVHSSAHHSEAKSHATPRKTNACDASGDVLVVKRELKGIPSRTGLGTPSRARERGGLKECFDEGKAEDGDGHDEARQRLRKAGHLAVPTGVYMPVAVRRLLEGTNGQIPPATRLAFEGQLWDCAAEHGLQPLRRALQKLATSLPSNPAALARYFRPILGDQVKAWRAEQAQAREWQTERDRDKVRQRELWENRPDPVKTAERLARMRERLKRGPPS